jgi:hypothetical protein
MPVGGGRGAYGYAAAHHAVASATAWQAHPAGRQPGAECRVQSFLQGLASVGTEILYTCRENKMQCNQIVNL